MPRVLAPRSSAGDGSGGTLHTYTHTHCNVIQRYGWKVLQFLAGGAARLNKHSFSLLVSPRDRLLFTLRVQGGGRRSKHRRGPPPAIISYNTQRIRDCFGL